MGLETEAEIMSNPLVAGYQHEFLLLTDTKTHEQIVTRAGPKEHYNPLGVIRNETQKSATGKGNVKLVTTMVPAEKSADFNDKHDTLQGSKVTLKPDLASVKSSLQNLNNKVDSSQTDYRPQTINSNAYINTVYQALTGSTQPQNDKAPGSNLLLKLPDDPPLEKK